VPEGDVVIPFGQAVVKREGSDMTIIAPGSPVTDALGAAEKLAAEGVSAEVVDCRLPGQLLFPWAIMGGQGEGAETAEG
jgi:pyruvate/2-oxoglutarate/acetoin dehydrogenase E1 component